MATNSKNDNNAKPSTKILIVDDDFEIATLVKLSLQKYGFKNVSAFTNPLLALKDFRKNYNDYSIVISNVRMPGLSGFEFADYISKVKPKIKVILMTAFDINNSDDMTINLKYNKNIGGIIQKPVSPKKLAKIMAETTTTN